MRGGDFRLTQLVNRKHPTVLRLRPLMASILRHLQHRHRRLPGPLPLYRRNRRLQVHDLQLQLEKDAYFFNAVTLFHLLPSGNRTIITSIACLPFLLQFICPFPSLPSSSSPPSSFLSFSSCYYPASIISGLVSPLKVFDRHPPCSNLPADRLSFYFLLSQGLPCHPQPCPQYHRPQVHE